MSLKPTSILLICIITILVCSCTFKSVRNAKVSQENTNSAHSDSLIFYPLNKEYIVQSIVEKTDPPATVTLQTCRTQKEIFVIEFGVASFQLFGEEFKLRVYEHPYKEDMLFIPFRDGTSSKSTFGAGRYIDLAYPKNNKLKIDFNQAYHPKCVYDIHFPSVVAQYKNRLEMEILAGVKLTDAEKLYLTGYYMF